MLYTTSRISASSVISSLISNSFISSSSFALKYFIASSFSSISILAILLFLYGLCQKNQWSSAIDMNGKIKYANILTKT